MNDREFVKHSYVKLAGVQGLAAQEIIRPLTGQPFVALKVSDKISNKSKDPISCAAGALKLATSQSASIHECCILYEASILWASLSRVVSDLVVSVVCAFAPWRT